MPWFWSGLDQEFARWDCAQHPFFRQLAAGGTDRDQLGDYVSQFAYLAQAREGCITEASRRSHQYASSLASLAVAERNRAQRWVGGAPL